MCLIQDKSFKQYAQKYAKSEDEFFKEYVPPCMCERELMIQFLCCF